MSEQPLKWGILGTARIAEKIAPAIQATPGAELVAIASRDHQRASDWAAAHGVPQAYGRYDDLLADPSLDAVYIPLPPALHAEWTIKAFAAGKHVLCEKPLAGTLTDAEAMVAASRQYQRLLVDGVMWRHHPRAAEMHARIQNGSLGTLRRVTSAFTFQGSSVWSPDDLRYRRELGGGSLLDLGWYCVGASLWAAGRMPERVWGTGRYRAEVDHDFSALLWFPDDVVASFDCGFDTSLRKWLEIAGTERSLVCDDFTRPWSNEKARFWVHDSRGKAEEHRSPVASQEQCLVAEVCRLIRTGEWSSRWADESLQVQRVCAALEQSARTGAVVEL